MKTRKQILLYVATPCTATSALLLLGAFHHGISSEWTGHVIILGLVLSLVGGVAAVIGGGSDD